jgi:hypothetical protein
MRHHIGGKVVFVIEKFRFLSFFEGDDLADSSGRKQSTNRIPSPAFRAGARANRPAGSVSATIA